MVTYLQSLQQGLRRLLERDERVYIMGEDVLDPYGGAFKVTRGLSTDFPGRVLTTPISEAAIVGLGNGMALRGLRPIVEIMFGDFMTLVADQLINYAAKFRAMYRARVTVPLVVRTPMGGGRGYGPTHSQSLEKLFLGIPHLWMFAPTHFHDPGRLLERVVCRDAGPSLFIEHKLLYPAPLAVSGSDDLRIETVEDERGFPVQLVRNYDRGAPDVTVIGYGATSLWLEPLLRQLAAEEIRVEACFPACIQPLPAGALAECVARSGRAVVVEEGTTSWGWGAEVAARLNAELWGRLRAPVGRIGAYDTIIPTAKPLEAEVLPSPGRIEEAILGVLA